ncbi:MAG: phosphatase PAP2 family protein [Actinomycetes bacterium]
MRRSGSSGDRDVPARLRSLCLRTIAACAAGFLLLWAVFIRLEAGRRFGNSAWSGRRALAPATRALHDDVLRTITTTSLALACVVLVLVGVARRRFLLGAAAAATVAAGTASAEVLKRFVITRPPTPGEVARLSGNSFPSGHATIATALALAAIMVTPHRWRLPLAVGLSLWVSFQAAGVLAAGWHRPSDALSGFMLALGWASFAVWLLAFLGRVEPNRDPATSPAATTVLFVGAASIALSGIVVAVTAGGFDLPGDATELLIANVVIDLVGVAVVWWFWHLLRPWTLDPARQEHDQSGHSITGAGPVTA